MTLPPLRLLRCPVCAGPLSPGCAPAFACARCGQRYPVRGGVVDFLVRPLPVVDEERQGNRVVAQEVRADADEGWLLGLPETFVRYLPEQDGHDVRADFESLLACARLPEGVQVLDLGAGCCWTSRLLAGRGYRVIAQDISEEKYVGLASGQTYLDAGTPHFDRMLFDMSSPWPIADASLDAVVGFCSIHHAHDLPVVFAEAHRTLRPGGAFAFVEASSACLPLFESASFGERERREFHANEHKHGWRRYRAVARRAGFAFQLRPAGSFLEKLERVARGSLGAVQRASLKHRLAWRARLVLRSAVVQGLLRERLFPAVSLLVGAQFVGICRKEEGE